MNWVEVVGYVASALVELSFAMRSVVKLRTVSLVGSAIFAVYGALTGAWPVVITNSVIALLNARKNQIFCVRGNCDTEVDQMVLPFPVLADYGFLLLGGREVYLTHGHVINKAHPLPFVDLAAADLPTLRKHARARGWSRLRLLSAGDSTFKYDLGSEDGDGVQDSTVSVFTRDADGTVRHRYSAHPRMAEDIDQRGLDLLSPVWHLLDLTPGGRGDWFADLDY